MKLSEHEKFLQMAIELAAKSAKSGKGGPFGAVIVKDGKVIAKAHNLVEKKQDATLHAEIVAIKKACRKLKSWRLNGTEMYITVEPCAMCAGAIANARIDKVYYGAREYKSGCAESKYPVLKDNGLNWSVEYQGGIEEERCSEILKNYFKNKRLKNLD